MPEEHRPGTVIVGIMTDGHENASKEWTRAAVKKLIEEQENQYDWTFSYWAPTRTPSKWAPPSVSLPNGLTYGTGNVADAMGAYGANSVVLGGAVAAGMSTHQARTKSVYSPAQRAAAAGRPTADPDEVDRPAAAPAPRTAELKPAGVRRIR